MKQLLDVLSVCREKGIWFSLDDPGSNLKMKGNIRLLTEEERQAVLRHKEEIIAMLSRTGNREHPIRPIAEQPHYVLSSAQQRMWVLGQLVGGGPAYHINMTNLLEGELHTGRLQLAFDCLIDRHGILRTVFKEDRDGEIRQSIRNAAEMNFFVCCTDLRNEVERDRKYNELARQARHCPFNLEEGPLLRANLYQLTDNRWIFDLVMHHIIADGWSMDILIRDLMHFYREQGRGGKGALASLPIQYKDYAHWQQQQLSGGMLDNDREYWLRKLGGELPVLRLPGDRARPVVKTYKGGAICKTLTKPLTAGLKALLRQQDSSLFQGLLALIKALLYRYTSQEDMIIGSPVAGREHAVLENQVGLYMNTLALRTRFKGTDTYLQLLANVKQVTLEAYAHQAYPFDNLVNELRLQRDTSRNALFDVMVTLASNAVAYQTEGLDDLHITEYKGEENRFSKFDLSFSFAERQDEITLVIGFNSDIYIPATIQRMADHIQRLLASILRDPDIPVNELEYLDPEEVQQLLSGFNRSVNPCPGDQTVRDLLEEQAQRTPDTIALVFGQVQLTYKEMNEKANRWANYLLANYPIRPDSLVAILLDRSAEMIIAILAILKTGGAYVPIDPEYPASRIEYLLKDSGAVVLLTASRYLPLLTACQGVALTVDGGITTPESYARCPLIPIDRGDLAYVIYTSGSTGQPKGVMISHGSLVDYFYGILATTNIRDCSHFGLFSTIAADLGNTVIYPSLLTGGTLHIYTRDDLLDAGRLAGDKLDCIKIVPSHWKSLQGTDGIFLPDKCLIFGGEPLTPDVLVKIKAAGRRCEVYNHYGPSETTIGKLIHHLDPDRSPPSITLGYPFCDSLFYILDENRRLLPTGITGEIYIGGAGLARGYLNKPELTAEKFVSNPYKKGERIYKTGDLGRWLPDGTIEFIGRKDEQVKIRGYRVEPGEVEAAIRDHKDIEAVVVLAKSNGEGEKELVAYLTGKPDLKIPEIRAYLGTRFPSYMIPTRYVRLEQLPLTINGKIDKRSLPDPEGTAIPTGTPYIPPRNETERILVTIWQELLGNKEIGIKDNFFDVGGHSLKIMQLNSRINKIFSVRLNIQSLFKEPVIENISEQIFFILNQNKLKENRKNLKQVEI